MKFKAFNQKIRVETDFSLPSGMKITGFFVAFILLFSSATPFAYAASLPNNDKEVLLLSPPKDPVDPACKGKVSISELSSDEYFALIKAAEGRKLDAFGAANLSEQQNAGIGQDASVGQTKNQF